MTVKVSGGLKLRYFLLYFWAKSWGCQCSETEYTNLSIKHHGVHWRYPRSWQDISCHQTLQQWGCILSPDPYQRSVGEGSVVGAGGEGGQVGRNLRGITKSADETFLSKIKIYLYIYPSIYLSIYISIYLSTYLSVYCRQLRLQIIC